jgi:V-type H+-transporting ATPase subunit a
MGFFAIYCGLIYNDFMSVPIDFFGSCYTIPEVNLKPQTILTQKPNCVYPIGVDPVWSVSDNYLNFINSLKMKLSVILGVIHMILGILIKGSNAIYFVRII